jgi:TfoX/Sxy family transcriptional regulator of competence genes
VKIAKPTEDDKAYFTELFGEHPALELKAMFGNLAAFVRSNEQMCAGLFGASVGLRLGENDRAELFAIDGAAPFGPEGRPMKEYVAIPPAWRESGDDVDGWIDRAIDHTQSLPPKKKKTPREKTASKKS